MRGALLAPVYGSFTEGCDTDSCAIRRTWRAASIEAAVQLCPKLCPRVPNATQLYPTPANFKVAEALISRPWRGDFKSVASASSAIPAQWSDVLPRRAPDCSTRARRDRAPYTNTETFVTQWGSSLNLPIGI